MSLPPNMSGAGTGKPPAGPAPSQDQTQSKLEHYPPPPPGPPPGQTPAASSGVPAYNPAAPTFAGPPSRADTDIYNAPEDQQPAPPMPPRPDQAATPSGQSPSSHAKPEKPAGKQGFSLSSLGHKLAGGINQVANKMGAEGFMPDSLDVECQKAARILRAFCKDGVEPESAAAPPPQTLATPAPQAGASGGGKSPDPKTSKQRKNRTLIHIPSSVISRAVGLAIFTNARAGYFVMGAVGSGVLLRRLPNGSWSAPVGIHVRVGGVGASGGADIFDCVLVFNSHKTLEPFLRQGTMTLGGGGISLTAGPWGAGGNVDFAGLDEPARPKSKGKSKEGEAPTAPGPSQAANTTKPAGASSGQTLQQPPAATTDGKQRPKSPFEKIKGDTVVSYVRSRGLFAGIQVDGTVLSERKTENARFYGAPGITAEQVLQKEIGATMASQAAWQKVVLQLLDAIRAAEGYVSGSGPNTPLDPPTTLMNQMRVDDTAHAAATPPAAAAGGSFPPPPPGPPPPNVASTMAHWKAGEAANESAQASSSSASFPPPPPGPPPASNNPNVGPAMVQWKAEEAGKEAAAAAQGDAPPPPSYSEFDNGDPAAHGQQPRPPRESGGAYPTSDLPPAYTEEGRSGAGQGDSKTAR